MSSSEEQLLDMAARSNDRLIRSVLHLERLRWARFCELMVEAIDNGDTRPASSRAAFSSLAKSLREASDSIRPSALPPGAPVESEEGG